MLLVGFDKCHNIAILIDLSKGQSRPYYLHGFTILSGLRETIDYRYRLQYKFSHNVHDTYISIYIVFIYLLISN